MSSFLCSSRRAMTLNHRFPFFFSSSRSPISFHQERLPLRVSFSTSENKIVLEEQKLPVEEKKTTQSKSRKPYWSTALILGGVVVGLAWYYDLGWYVEPLLPVVNTPEEQIQIIEQPKLPSEHPYDSFSWPYVFYIKVKRFFKLAGLFIPLAFVSFMMQVTKDESWRLYWLEFLIKTFEAAGCTFQKFGQWLSMRPDIFSPDVIEALSKLRDRLPAHDMKHTRKIIKEEFGCELEEYFETFEETPIASGSVAQVHHARLKEKYAINGKVRDVAVKVRHPNVVEECFVDVDYIFGFVNGLGAKLIGMTMPFNKTEFLAVMQRQIDFSWEAYNISKFTQNFKTEIAEGYLKFPSVSFDLLSPAIIIESWAHGRTVAEIFSDVGSGIASMAGSVGTSVGHMADSVGTSVGNMADSVEKSVGNMKDSVSSAIMTKKRALARTVFDMAMKMFLRDNMVHGDLHAGNLLYTDNGDHLTVLDMGLTCSLPPDMASPFGRFLHATCIGDADKLAENLLLFNAGKTPVDKPKFVQNLRELLENFVGPNRRAPDGTPIVLGDLMGQICFEMNKHRIELRGDVAVNLMTMGITEGLIRSLDPEFDVVQAALPYFVKYRGWKRAVLPDQIRQNYKEDK